MQKKMMGLVLALIMLLGTLVSCGDNEGSVREVYKLEKDESYVSTVNGQVFNLDGNGVSGALYTYVYNDYKQLELDYYKEYDSYYSGAISAVVTIEDSEEFWTTKMPDSIKSNIAMSEDNITFTDVLLDRVEGVFSYLLAYEALAKQYDYVPARDCEGYQTIVNDAIVDAIKNAGIVEDNEQIADEKTGVLYDWVLDRWDTYLAGKGINSAEWVRIYCDYSVYSDNLMDFVLEKGAIEPMSEAEAKEELTKELEKYKSERVKFQYIVYKFITEEEFDTIKEVLESTENEESSEESAEESSEEDAEASAEENSEEISEEISEESGDTSDDVSGDTDNGSESDEDKEDGDKEEKTDFYTQLVSECETYEEVNEKIKAICEEIFNGLLDGSRDFDEEYKACPYYELLNSYYPKGVIVTKKEYTEVLGDDPDEIALGDMRKYVNDKDVQIIKMLELTDDDIGTEPTDEDIKAWVKQSTQSKYGKLLKELKDKVVGDDDWVEDFLQPWKV